MTAPTPGDVARAGVFVTVAPTEDAVPEIEMIDQSSGVSMR